MAVHDIRTQVVFTHALQGIIGKHIKAIPELLFGKVGFIAAVKSNNTHLV